ncbi:MAG: diguanylate cyclase [Chloroflexota bacterium]
MNTHVVIPTIACIAYLPLIAVLFANRPWDDKQRLFLGFVIPAFLWSLTDLVARSDYFVDHKTLLAQVVICVAIWAIVQYHYFLTSYFRHELPRVPVAYLFVVATVALSLGGWIPREVVLTAEGLTVHYGLPLVIIAGLMAGLLGGGDGWALLKLHRRSTDAVERNQLAYLIATICIFIFFIMLSFTPSGGSFPWAHIGNLMTAGVLMYSVVAHRLLDIGVVMRRGIFYAVLYGGGAGTLLLVFALLRFVFGFEYDRTTAGVLVAVGIPIVFILNHVIRDLLQRKVEAAFVGNRYEARRQLSEFVERIYDVPTLEQFGRQLVSLLARSVDAKVAYLLLPEQQGADFVVHFSYPSTDEPGDFRPVIRHESPVLTWLRREGQLLPVRHLSILPEFQGLWKQEREEVRTAGIELFLPLANRGELVAVLAVGSKAGGKSYSVEELELMHTVAGKVAASMEKQYLYEQLQKQDRELTLLNRLSRVVTSSLDMRDAFQGFSRELKKVVPLDHAAVALIDGDRIKLQAIFGRINATDLAEMSHSLAGTATEWIARHRRTVYQPDLQTKKTYWPDEHYAREGLRSIVHVPLIVRDQVIGTLMVANQKPNVYTEESLSLLEQVSRQIATPLENAVLYARAQQRSRIDELTGLFNRRHFDERLKEEVSRHSRQDSVFSLLMMDLDSFKAYNDMYGHPSGDKLLKLVASLVSTSIRESDQGFRYGGDEFAVLLPHTGAEEAFVVAERVRTRVSREMEAKRSGVTSSIGLASYPADGVMPGELVATADTALYYAKNTGGNRTYVSSKIFSETEPVSESRNNHRGSGLSAVYALAAAVDAKDHYTYGHSRKVNTYAVVLAESVGLPSDEVSRISTSALLHDIGKIGIPDRILNKKGELDDEEWDAIKSHPRLGANIVGNVPDLAPCVGAILYHHERWDGTGYPEGLRGKSIPIGARILSIADAFAAMASIRPYRDALPDEIALQRLKEAAGTQFDPDLVGVFAEEVETGLPHKDGVSRVPPIQQG